MRYICHFHRNRVVQVLWNLTISVSTYCDSEMSEIYKVLNKPNITLHIHIELIQLLHMNNWDWGKTKR